ncbi:ATP-dependent RNA helicase dbp7 [Coemansia guatemalensis]|uniref:ATP-dependent RNA helicase n=1 Tax=Coemansia guatemalensis TaxID=2761395 RepID=A0A9W8I5B0_9FUNG|nr:ATP-dependent RNA helicase dbp7 [Coemansia guatemalensis]
MSAGDDGLVLNFATDTGPTRTMIPINQKPRGGRWKDRMEERRKIKSEIWKARKQTDRQQTGVMQAKHTDVRASESNIGTQKEQSQQALSTVDNGNQANNTNRRANNAGYLSQTNRHIVSSLFTRNPEIPTLPQSAGQENRVSSNAVIDTSSFEGIGLNAGMLEYMSNKMDIAKPTAIQQNAIPVLIGKPIQALIAGADDSNDDGEFDVERAANVEHDVFIQAATGSGKTLSYLLPIFHRLVQAGASATAGQPPSRSLGTFAIVLTPTRELAQQVLETAQQLAQSAGSRSNWIVPGIVIGGDKKQSEKSRLRKGVTVLACTPGRLLDHLENTQSFVVDHLRWLVLDEADRLLELGFEETLTKILALLDEKAKRRVRVLGHRTMETSLELPRRRINVLCSATLRDNVKRLANESLHNPRFISATRIYGNAEAAAAEVHGEDVAEENSMLPMDVDSDQNFSLPSQLVQKAVVIPAKLRLVTLVAQLRNTLRRLPTSKIIVFMSCTDSVDFMYFLLAYGGIVPETSDAQTQAEDLFKTLDSNGDGDDGNDSDDRFHDRKQPAPATADLTLREEDITLDSSVVPGAGLYRLHGSMLQKRRTETYTAFSKARHAAVLFTTDVAARGLDLPNVTSIVQFDPPTGIASYLHRVGRTARLGRSGEASLFLLPSESKYLTLLAQKGLRPDDETMEVILKQMAKHEGARKASEWQLRAGEVQSMLERFVAFNATAASLARQAYLSSIRAYATHVAEEKHVFNVRALHLGHLAKAFALREAPNQVATGKGNNARADDTRKEKKEKRERELAAKKKPKFKRGNDISEFAVGDISAYYAPRVKRTKDSD